MKKKTQNALCWPTILLFFMTDQEMANSKTPVLEDVPERKEGETDEETKSSSNIRDQGDKIVTVHLSN